MNERVTVVVDDYALEALPGLERDLARSGALLMRSFKGLPNPNLLRRFRAAAVVGAPDRAALRARLETASAGVPVPVIGVLPRGAQGGPDLRGPGVVDLVPAGLARAAERILLMARVPVVTAVRPGGPAPPPSDVHRPTPTLAPVPLRAASPPVPDAAAEILAVASSTGGVWVLASMLRDLDTGWVVAIAQHLESDFVPFFAEWLQAVSGWRTVVVGEPIPYARGLAYVPAGGWDLLVERGVLRAAPPSSRHVPSGDRLLGTAARSIGGRAAGLVLSGMGADGSEGLAGIAAAGGRTFCQAPASAVVPSMPASALSRAPGTVTAPPEALASTIGRPGSADVGVRGLARRPGPG
ncbi:MAG TPA: chemotaxis protein CheB [Anaeromyxobacteraceae bacterium]|nr:chemotaxis protein CheB [Anaeromyxobacteraceae bacterium]